MLLRLLTTLSVAATLTACGGGEDYEDPANTATSESAPDELPNRSQDWLVPYEEREAPST